MEKKGLDKIRRASRRRRKHKSVTKDRTHTHTHTRHTAYPLGKRQKTRFTQATATRLMFTDTADITEDGEGREIVSPFFQFRIV